MVQDTDNAYDDDVDDDLFICVFIYCASYAHMVNISELEVVIISESEVVSISESEMISISESQVVIISESEVPDRCKL